MPVDDPSNRDRAFDRVRVREALKGADWLDTQAIATSAGNLADAEDALIWATEREWQNRVEITDVATSYRPSAPHAIRLRVVTRIIARWGSTPDGGGVAKLIEVLNERGTANLAGVIARASGDGWHFTREPPRRN